MMTLRVKRLRLVEHARNEAIRSSQDAPHALRDCGGGGSRVQEDRALHAIVGARRRLMAGQLDEKKPLRGKCQLRGMLGESASRADP